MSIVDDVVPSLPERGNCHLPYWAIYAGLLQKVPAKTPSIDQLPWHLGGHTVFPEFNRPKHLLVLFDPSAIAQNTWRTLCALLHISAPSPFHSLQAVHRDSSELPLLVTVQIYSPQFPQIFFQSQWLASNSARRRRKTTTLP